MRENALRIQLPEAPTRGAEKLCAPRAAGALLSPHIRPTRTSDLIYLSEALGCVILAEQMVD